MSYKGQSPSQNTSQMGVEYKQLVSHSKRLNKLLHHVLCSPSLLILFTSTLHNNCLLPFFTCLETAPSC